MRFAGAATRRRRRFEGRGTGRAPNTSSRGFGVRYSGMVLVSAMVATALFAGCSNNGATSTGLVPGGRTDTTGIGKPGGTIAPPSATAAVNMGNIFFMSGRNGSSNPAVDRVAVGGTVTWTFGSTGSTPHSVQSVGSPSFTSSAVLSGRGSTYQVTFAQPGVCQYNCAIHGSLMTGTIVVLAAAPAPSATTRPGYSRNTSLRVVASVGAE
jgi:plastocyanin